MSAAQLARARYAVELRVVQGDHVWPMRILMGFFGGTFLLRSPAEIVVTDLSTGREVLVDKYGKSWEAAEHALLQIQQAITELTVDEFNSEYGIPRGVEPQRGSMSCGRPT